MSALAATLHWLRRLLENTTHRKTQLCQDIMCISSATCLSSLSNGNVQLALASCAAEWQWQLAQHLYILTTAALCRCILTAAQLISERIDRSSVTAGFDWCAEQLRQAGFVKLAAEVQLAKAGHFLFLKDVAGAAAVFKDFDKKESVVR